MWIVYVLFIGLPAYGIVMGIYRMKDHWRWERNSKPSENAIILGVKVKKVGIMKFSVKFKSTVWFDDGFRFVTYETNEMMTGFTREISVFEYDIREKAKQGHEEALDKLRKQGKLPPKPPKKVSQPTVQQAGWQCSCGRTHKAFESSCICGLTKQDAKK